MRCAARKAALLLTEEGKGNTIRTHNWYKPSPIDRLSLQDRMMAASQRFSTGTGLKPI